MLQYEKIVRRKSKMKKIILSAVVSSALIMGVTGCGDSQKKASSTQAVKQESKKVSKEDRQKALNSRINSYAKYGFDINKTSEKSYILSIKEPAKAANLLLSMFSLNLSVSDTDKEALQNAINGAKFSVDIDWDKYVANQKDSVEVDYIGKGDESKAIAKILQDKKVGAYLTYNGSDELKKIDFKNIDEKVMQDNEELHIQLANAFVDISKLPNENSDDRVYTFNGGDMSVSLKDEFNSTVEVGYKNTVCNVDKSNSYLGTQDCKIPTISIVTDKGSKEELDITINDTVYNYKSVAKNGKLDEDVLFSIKSIDTNTNIHVKGIKVSTTFNDIDENIIKEYMNLVEAPSANVKQDLGKLLSLAGKIYQGGSNFTYDVSLDTIKADTTDINVQIEGYTEKGKGSFDKNITYDDVASIKNITLSDPKNKNNGFVLENFRLNTGVKDVYNMIPELMDILGVLSSEDNVTKVQTTMQKDGTALANKIVNQGFGVYIKPLGFDKVNFSNRRLQYALGKSDFDIDVRLVPNNVQVDTNNPMLPMMLISYLKADGKLVVPIKDLQELAKKPEFAMLGMLMMMAKIEGENAVFVIKFENGKLLVNGQPMM